MSILENESALVVQKQGLIDIPDTFSRSLIKFRNNYRLAVLLRFVKCRLDHLGITAFVLVVVNVNEHVNRLFLFFDAFTCTRCMTGSRHKLLSLFYYIIPTVALQDTIDTISSQFLAGQ